MLLDSAAFIYKKFCFRGRSSDFFLSRFCYLEGTFLGCFLRWASPLNFCWLFNWNNFVGDNKNHILTHFVECDFKRSFLLNFFIQIGIMYRFEWKNLKHTFFQCYFKNRVRHLLSLRVEDV